MHCNLRTPEPRHPSPALITTPCQVWSRSTYSLPYYSVRVANTLLYGLRCDLDLWLLTLNIYSVSTVTWWNYVPNLNAMEQSAVELLRFHCLTLWPCTLRYVLRWALGYFYQVWLLTIYPSLNYSVLWWWYTMSRVDLESSWDIKRQVVKVCTKFERNRAIPGWLIIWRIFANVMSRCDLDLWPLNFELL